MADEKVIVGLELSRQDLKKIENQTDNTFKKAGNSAGTSFSTGLKTGLIAAGVGLGLFAKNAISAASGLEDITANFTTFLKSGEAARDLVKDLVNFTATTPFQLEGVASAAKILIAFGEDADNITDRLRKIGDVAAGSGNSLKELATVFGQVRSATRLTGERLLQFQERGVNVLPALAKQFGVLESEVRDLVSTGKVSFKDFEQAFDSLSAKGGLFFGGTIRQSKTLSGQISTLKDNFSLFSAQLGQIFLPLAKQVTSALTDLFKTGSNLITGVFGSESEKRVLAINTQLESLKRGAKVLAESLKEAAPEGEQGFFSRLFSGDSRSQAEIQEQLDSNLEKIRELEAEKASIEASEKSRSEARKARLASEAEVATTANATLFESFVAGFAQVDKSASNTSKVITQFGMKAKAALATGVGQGFAAVGKALVEGTNALDAFAAAFLGSIGQAMVAQGTQFILTGIGYQFLPGFQGVGAGLIGAGSALAVAGGALSAVASGLNKPSAAAGGAAIGAGGFAETGALSDETLAQQEEQGPRVSVTIQGDVLDSDETGLRIVDLLNRSVDDSSVKIRRTAIA